MRLGARWGGILAAAVALVALAACGTPASHVSTGKAVGDAVGNALAQPGLNLRMSLGVTPDEARQMGGAALAQTSLTVNVYPGSGESTQSQQFATDHNKQLEFALDSSGARVVDVRYLNSVLYVQADLNRLLSGFNGHAGAATNLPGELAKADQYVPGLAALLAGKWVSLSAQDLAPLLHLGGLSGGDTSTYQAGSATLLKDLQNALRTNTTYTFLGTQGGVSEYQAAVSARAVAGMIAPDVSKLIGSAPIPGATGVANQIAQSVARVPKTVVLQLWVKDNKAQEVDLDLNQFDHKYPFAVPLKVVIGAGERVSTPSPATPLKISGLAGLLGGMGGLGQAPAGS